MTKELTILRAALAEQPRNSRAYRIILAGIARLQALEDIADTPTEKSPAVQCAWCLAQNGQPMGEGSHGICPRHAAQVIEKSRERRARKLVA